VDAQLKYRLTGAVILVLLAVLFVPELLTGPKPSRPAPGRTAPAATTPDGAPLRSYDIDLSDPGSSTATADDAPGPVATPPADSAPPAEPADAPAVAPRAAATVAGARPAPAPTPGASRAAPPANSTPAASVAPSQAPTRGFAVQVGSFASRDSADRLAGELRGRRFETFVSPVRSAGRQMYRVRVGPVADRTAAQALVTRLKAAGQSGTVVALP
jgi:DedD protein